MLTGDLGNGYFSKIKAPAPKIGAGAYLFSLLVEYVLQCLFVDIAVQLSEVGGQLDVLRADLYAVLAVAAAGDAAFAHQSIQAFFLVELSEGMQVEKIRLYRRGSADEVGLRSNVRTYFETAAASHAMRNFICSCSRIRVLNRRVLDFPSAIDLNPAVDALQ